MASAIELRSLLAQVEHHESIATAYNGATLQFTFAGPSINFSTATNPGDEWEAYYAPMFAEQRRLKEEMHEQLLVRHVRPPDEESLPDLSIVGPPPPRTRSTPPVHRPRMMVRG